MKIAMVVGLVCFLLAGLGVLIIIYFNHPFGAWLARIGVVVGIGVVVYGLVSKITEG